MPNVAVELGRDVFDPDCKEKLCTVQPAATSHTSQEEGKWCVQYSTLYTVQLTCTLHCTAASREIMNAAISCGGHLGQAAQLRQPDVRPRREKNFAILQI